MKKPLEVGVYGRNVQNHVASSKNIRVRPADASTLEYRVDHAAHATHRYGRPALCKRSDMENVSAATGAGPAGSIRGRSGVTRWPHAVRAGRRLGAGRDHFLGRICVAAKALTQPAERHCASCHDLCIRRVGTAAVCGMGTDRARPAGLGPQGDVVGVGRCGAARGGRILDLRLGPAHRRRQPGRGGLVPGPVVRVWSARGGCWASHRAGPIWWAKY
jgi:hypothetical protein